MKGVACFGDCNIDLITTIPSIPVLGGCVFSDAVHFNVGGDSPQHGIRFKTSRD
jgi:hypothetical protein